MSNILQIKGHDFGRSMAATSDNNDFFISSPLDQNGKVFLYQRSFEDQDLIKSLEFVPPQGYFETENCRFGQSISVTPDGEILAIGIPNAAMVKTRFKGDFALETQYQKGDIVSYRATLYRFNVDLSEPLSSLEDFFNSASQIFYIPADKNGTSEHVNEGAVAIYTKVLSRYVLQTIITNDFPESNVFFGSNVEIRKTNNGYKLFVSTSNGFIRIYNYKFSGEWLSSTSYNEDDYVRFNGVFYRSIINNNTLTPGQDNFQAWTPVSSPWHSNIDKNFRFVWNPSDPYKINELVVFNDELWRAKTNIPAGAAFSETLWEKVTGGVDYLGFLPNNTGAALFGENTYEPENTEFLTDDFAVSEDSSTIVFQATSVTGIESTIGRVLVYLLDRSKYVLAQVIDQPTNAQTFGTKVAVSPDGKFIAVSDLLNSSKKISKGRVFIYKKTPHNGYVLHQELSPLQNEEAEKFGFALSWGKDTLAISSLNGDSVKETTFDKNLGTVFDRRFTRFSDKVQDTGIVYLYENINGVMIASEKLYHSIAGQIFGENVLSNTNHIYVGLSEPRTLTQNGSLFNYRKDIGTNAWKKIRELTPPVSVSEVSNIFLYNKRTNTKLIDLDFIDPIQGKIAAPASAEITFKTHYDPAYYNVDPKNSGDESIRWAESHVGELWWDLSTARFTYPYQGTAEYQSDKWNEVQPEASIDVYEWVKTRLLPEEWDNQADTSAGLEKDISGISKYSNDRYVVRYEYDVIAKVFSPVYYFWVKSKRTVPEVKNRKISAFDVERLISSPREQGYRFVSLLNKNRFVLNNVNQFITDNDVVLSINLRPGKQIDYKIHNEFVILSDNLESSVPPRAIEQKWIDSLVGATQSGQLLPDTNIPIKQRYGVLNKPMQTMFVNRREALKEVIDRVNSVIEKTLVVDEYDTSDLNLFDPEPSKELGEYDQILNSVEELRFIGTNRLSQAELRPVINNGQIVSVQILNPGRGYKTPPRCEILGSGVDADIKLSINNLGQVERATVITPGSGYSDQTSLFVRQFSILIPNDRQLQGKWSLYSWDDFERQWNRTRVQSYDVRNYWKSIDWYADGYSALTTVDYVVDFSYELFTLQDQIGDIVKIRNIGEGGWLLLEKIADIETEDYTQKYRTVGRQDGTIKFLDTLFSATYGYDTNSYDSTFYDKSPAIETRIILETLKDKLLTKELKIEYNQLFFASMRYILSEQDLPDWLMKTSFVKIKHNLGELEQKLEFDRNKLQSYQDYVEEVKPFKSNIREFISAYEKTDNSNTVTTDFDLPSFYDGGSKTFKVPNPLVIENEIVNVERQLFEFPRKHWLDNNTYYVDSVIIADGGSGYKNVPEIRFVGGGGSGAEAVAFINNGKITAINVTSPGSGYITAPQIVIDNAIEGDDLVPAKLSVVIDNKTTRKFKPVIKFDRTSGKQSVKTMAFSETFVGTGNKTRYQLSYPISTETNSYSVFVDNVEILSSEYKINNTKTNNNTTFGFVEFVDPPKPNSTILIKYAKDLPILSAFETFVGTGNKTRYQLSYPISTETNSYSVFVDNVEILSSEYKINNTKIKKDNTTTTFGFIEFFNPPKLNSTILIEYTKDSSILSAEDRISQFYSPTENMEGKDLGQLMDGVDYGGVEVYGMEFGQPFGWDTDKWDDIGWDLFPAGTESAIIFKIEEETTKLNIVTPFNDGVVYNIYKNGIRLDDPNFGQDNVTNTNAVTTPIIGDSSETEIDLDELGITVDVGDILVFREITSDGSTPFDPLSYDIDLSGGNLSYSNAKGILPEEVIVDGDGFVTQTTSKGPEEMVPGQVMDTLDIKVYTQGTFSSSTIVSQNFVSTETNVFSLIERPANNKSVIVKVNNVILPRSDFSISWKNNTVKVKNLQPNSNVSILTVTEGLQNVLFYDIINASGSQNVFEIEYTFDEAHGIWVTVNGDPVNFVYRESEKSNNFSEIELDFIPEADDIIRVVVFSNNDKIDYSQISTNEFIGDNSTLAFELADVPFYSTPLEQKMLVSVDNKFLSAGYSRRFVITEARERTLQIERFQRPIGSTSLDDIRVFVNNNETKSIRDWEFDPSNQTVILNPGVASPGDIVDVFDTSTQEYTIIENNLVLKEPALENQVIKVYAFSNHDILESQRFTYDVVQRDTIIPGSVDELTYNRLQYGEIKLRFVAKSAKYVWVFKNGEKLSPSVDYELNESGTAIQLAPKPSDNDTFDVIQFKEPNASVAYSFGVFKDILNRVHYKRVDAPAAKLSENLTIFSKQIKVNDATHLPEPNKKLNRPGVVMIDKERIEYFEKNGNTLSQIRRATLGTGAKTMYAIGTPILDMGPSKTIPYTDNQQQQTIISDGSTQSFVLNFECSTENDFEIFVGGRRLRKNKIRVFDQSLGQISPDADRDEEPEFIFDPDTNSVILKQIPDLDTRIIAVKRVGKLWTQPGESLQSSNNKISNFLRFGQK